MKRHAVWRAPIAIAVVSLLGLIVGLLGDGPWDWGAWLGLGLPVAACAWFGLKRPAKATPAAGKSAVPTIRG